MKTKTEPKFTLNRILDDLDRVGTQLGNCYDVFEYESDHDEFHVDYDLISDIRKARYQNNLNKLLNLVNICLRHTVDSKNKK